MSRNRLRHVADQLCLAGLVEIVLVLGVGTAMPDHLVTARAELGDHLRAMVVNFRVQQE